jgi:hypothetical protein
MKGQGLISFPIKFSQLTNNSDGQRTPATHGRDNNLPMSSKNYPAASWRTLKEMKQLTSSAHLPM